MSEREHLLLVKLYVMMCLFSDFYTLFLEIMYYTNWKVCYPLEASVLTYMWEMSS